MPGLSIRPEFPGCRGSWLPQNAGWPARPRTSAAAAASSPASGRRAGSLLCALCGIHLAVKGLGGDQKESCKPRLFQFSGCSGFSPPATGPAVGCDARDRAGKGRGTALGRGLVSTQDGLGGDKAQGAWDALLSTSPGIPLMPFGLFRAKRPLGVSDRPRERKHGWRPRWLRMRWCRSRFVSCLHGFGQVPTALCALAFSLLECDGK